MPRVLTIAVNGLGLNDTADLLELLYKHQIGYQLVTLDMDKDDVSKFELIEAEPSLNIHKPILILEDYSPRSLGYDINETVKERLDDEVINMKIADYEKFHSRNFNPKPHSEFSSREMRARQQRHFKK